MLTPSTSSSKIYRIRILVVSEQSLVQAELRKFLGLQPDLSIVGEVGDGLTANELARKLQPDVLLLDGTASGRESLATLAALKEASPQLPIVFLALQNSKTYIQKVFEAGAAGYVVSTSEDQDIAKAIREVHAGSLYMSPRIRDFFLCFTDRAQPSVGTLVDGEDLNSGENPQSE